MIAIAIILYINGIDFTLFFSGNHFCYFYIIYIILLHICDVFHCFFIFIYVCV